MKNNLQGKTALVTGASSGLGMDFSRELARRGCQLILVARREDRLRELLREISSTYDVPVEIIAMDLVEADAPRRLYDHLQASHRAVDVLINNAGYGLFGDFAEIPWERTQNMLDLDIRVLTHLMRLFMADMVSRNYGFILNIASTGAYQPTPTYAAYSAAKSYVVSLTEAVHYELRHTKVKCTVLSPGVTRTEFLAVAGQKPTLYQRSIMMESAAVARIGIKAMLKGRSSVVAGGLNAFMAWTMRFVPPQLQAALANLAMRA
jgi:short-subunit dehydrogenase